jgi:hypothetical protein
MMNGFAGGGGGEFRRPAGLRLLLPRDLVVV